MSDKTVPVMGVLESFVNEVAIGAYTAEVLREKALLALKRAAATPGQAEDKTDNFMRGVIAALGVLRGHGYKHGDVYHDEIVLSVGEKELYAAAEDEDYEWAGLNKRKKPRALKSASVSEQKGEMKP